MFKKCSHFYIITHLPNISPIEAYHLIHYFNCHSIKQVLSCAPY